MKNILLKTYTLPVFMLTLRMAAPMAGIRILAGPVRLWMRILGKLVHWASGGPKANDSKELAQAWQDMMPEPRSCFPLKGEQGNGTASVFAGEIHLHCPLRNSADTMACYQLMEFDRTLVQAAGGQLNVLESQSNSGKPFCTVLMAMDAESLSGFKAAHESRAS